MSEDTIFNCVVINEIYKNLSLKDLCNCALVNKRFNGVFKKDLSWKKLFEKDEAVEDFRVINEEELTMEVYKKYKLLSELEEVISYVIKSCRPAKYFNLRDKRLKAIHLQIVSLEIEKIYNEKLKTIPLGITYFINLQTLHLHRNHISIIQVLYLDNNRIKKIPLWITSLVSLRTLCVNKNFIKGISYKIRNMHNLNLQYKCQRR